jgi:hypothetical protein
MYYSVYRLKRLDAGCGICTSCVLCTIGINGSMTIYLIA